MCVLTTALASPAATLFSDNFSDTSSTEKVKWSTSAGLGFNPSYLGGTLVLKNPDTTYSAFYMHIFPASSKPSTFTLSATITVSNPMVNGAGIMYCLNSTGGIQGYTLQLGNTQYLFCYKYLGASGLDIKNMFCPFVKPFPSTNTVTVSKSGSVFTLFCNGHYVTRFSDAGFSSGDIAFLVPPGDTITANSIVMTDQVQKIDSSACYSDSFKTTASDAWSSPSAGMATFGGGNLVLNNTDTVFSSLIYTDGVSPKASMRAVISHTRGVGGYGLAFVESDSNRATPFAFVVDSARSYSVVNPDSSTLTYYPGAGIFGGLGTDTLEVRQFAKSWKFFVNGALQDSMAIPSDFRVDGFGLYASKSTSASCSYFVAGGDSTGAFCSGTPVVSKIPATGITARIPVFAKGSVVYDMRGRRIGTFDKASFAKSGLARGLYFVVPAGEKLGSATVMRVMKVGD
jgi:hypothetical protein